MDENACCFSFAPFAKYYYLLTHICKLRMLIRAVCLMKRSRVSVYENFGDVSMRVRKLLL